MLRCQRFLAFGRNAEGKWSLERAEGSTDAVGRWPCVAQEVDGDGSRELKMLSRCVAESFAYSDQMWGLGRKVDVLGKGVTRKKTNSTRPLKQSTWRFARLFQNRRSFPLNFWWIQNSFPQSNPEWPRAAIQVRRNSENFAKWTEKKRLKHLPQNFSYTKVRSFPTKNGATDLHALTNNINDW